MVGVWVYMVSFGERRRWMGWFYLEEDLFPKIAFFNLRMGGSGSG